MSEEEISARALRCHKEYPLFDGHNDLPWAFRTAFNMKLSSPDSPDLRDDLKAER